MEKESDKTIGEKLGAFANCIRNAKFLVLTVITLVFLAVAIISGNGKNIFSNTYEKITGQKYQTFSSVRDYSNPAYILLKEKISRDQNIGLENAVVTVFEESATAHRYRVEFNNNVYYYYINQKPNGVWHINKESGAN